MSNRIFVTYTSTAPNAFSADFCASVTPLIPAMFIPA